MTGSVPGLAGFCVLVSALVATLLAAACGSDAASAPDALPGGMAVGAQANCATGGMGATRVVHSRDEVLGPLVLLGARQTTREPDAFGGRGYKVPVTLARGMSATLSVSRSKRDRVGLVFTRAAQSRVLRVGVRGADSAVRFEACAAAERAGRTGWPGGFVVDRPRCATLVLKVEGRPAVRRRVSLGRRC